MLETKRNYKINFASLEITRYFNTIFQDFYDSNSWRGIIFYVKVQTPPKIFFSIYATKIIIPDFTVPVSSLLVNRYFGKLFEDE